jgi:hypothetical protein
VNYALNDHWRVSLRGGYLEDQQGFITSTPGGQHLTEGTLTVAYAPEKHFELRLEGRSDSSQKSFFYRTNPETGTPATTDRRGMHLAPLSSRSQHMVFVHQCISQPDLRLIAPMAGC